MVFLDATTGKLLNRYSLMDDALDRELYEDRRQPGEPADDRQATPVWIEGDTFPGA